MVPTTERNSNSSLALKYSYNVSSIDGGIIDTHFFEMFASLIDEEAREMSVRKAERGGGDDDDDAFDLGNYHDYDEVRCRDGAVKSVTGLESTARIPRQSRFLPPPPATRSLWLMPPWHCA